MASFFFTQDESARIDTKNDADPTQLTVLSARRVGHVRLLPSAPVTATADSPPRRAEAAPPSLFRRARPAWMNAFRGFWCWLWDMDEAPAPAAIHGGLGKVKAEFHAAMWDLQSLQANEVRDHVEHARSLRELWHLRAQVFKVISVHRGQMEAQVRLDGLDAHFPVKSSRKPDTGRSSRW